MRIVLPLLLAGLIGTAPVRESPELAGIAHVAFRVTDVPQSREFYRKLGFEQSFEFADPGKLPVSYMKINDRQFIELYGRADDSQALGLMHVCYEVDDIDALVSEYAKRGLHPRSARKARAGNLLFAIRDPEDQIVEYTQYLPGSLHFEDRGKHLGEHRISQHLLAAGVSVRDLAAERAFYTAKLAFENGGGNGDAIGLRLPGRSMEEIRLEPQAPAARTEIVFGVPNLKHTSEDLRDRGIVVPEDKDAVSAADPDGTRVIFMYEQARRP
jgi:catechol 2,3-dioxygenase-like lactoylglutathione lyase family enzyme